MKLLNCWKKYFKYEFDKLSTFSVKNIKYINISEIYYPINID